MTSNDCNVVRREIDEADLNQQLSSAASQHLRSCPACRTFDDERSGLRSLMSSLETVAAPADFDFRLRARLAREKDRPNGVFAFGDLIGARSLATVALVLLIAVAGLIVRNRMSSTNGRAAVQVNTPIHEVRTAKEEIKEMTPAAPPVPSQRDSETIAAKGSKTPAAAGPRQRHLARTPATGGQSIANVVAQNRQGVRESGGTPSMVVTPVRAADAEPVVRIPIDGRALRLSVDNGRGSSRTISLPSFSFGSQRVASGFSFAPTAFEKEHKGVW
jgi:hypothetical protein